MLTVPVRVIGRREWATVLLVFLGGRPPGNVRAQLVVVRVYGGSKDPLCAFSTVY
jgi:hypothetical protein